MHESIRSHPLNSIWNCRPNMMLSSTELWLKWTMRMKYGPSFAACSRTYQLDTCTAKSKAVESFVMVAFWCFVFQNWSWALNNTGFEPRSSTILFTRLQSRTVYPIEQWLHWYRLCFGILRVAQRQNFMNKLIEYEQMGSRLVELSGLDIKTTIPYTVLVV